MEASARTNGTDDIELAIALADARDRGRSLDRLFYTSPAVYERDLERVWGSTWVWVGHASQIPEAGDYFTFEFGDESVIVVRGEDGEIHAHMNVCRHRGSRVCLEEKGREKSFVCPYHGWTYNLDGSFRSARLMGAETEGGDLGLLHPHLLVFEGLIFVCLADAPHQFGDRLEELRKAAEPFRLADLKVAHTERYPVPANWKLAVENYMECYHCAPAHKDYSRSHTLKSPAQMAARMEGLAKRSAEAGLPTEVLNLQSADAPGATVYYRRYPLYEGYDTGSKDGKPLAPLLGSLKSFDGGATDIQVGMLNNFLVYSDHVVGYRFIPRGLQQTDLHVEWLVRADAVEDRDYDTGRLAWLWDATSKDDERIIRHNQEGVNSRSFRPGPLSTEMEWGIVDFHDHYLALFCGAALSDRSARLSAGCCP